MRVMELPRDTFISRYWQYRAGEHVTFLGPTGKGKTTLAYQLLDATATEKLPAVTLVMKPRDTTVAKWDRRLKSRVVRNWPPSRLRPWQDEPRSYTVWPPHTFRDIHADNERMRETFFRAITDCYRSGRRIIFADELYGLCREIGLETEIVAIYTRGRSMECGLWGASQRPSHIPLWAYSQAAHLFIHRDPDRRARDRYAEIGGIDPDLVKKITVSLPPYHYLYINQHGPYMCVIRAD